MNRFAHQSNLESNISIHSPTNPLVIPLLRHPIARQSSHWNCINSFCYLNILEFVHLSNNVFSNLVTKWKSQKATFLRSRDNATMLRHAHIILTTLRIRCSFSNTQIIWYKRKRKPAGLLGPNSHIWHEAADVGWTLHSNVTERKIKEMASRFPTNVNRAQHFSGWYEKWIATLRAMACDNVFMLFASSGSK
jgi:hypothetical protein